MSQASHDYAKLLAKASVMLATVAVSFSGAGISMAAETPLPDSGEIKTLYDADQRDRAIMESSGSSTWDMKDMMHIAQADADRRKRTTELLNDGKIQSADDYYYAAMVMQHGDKPSDYLLAHVLASASVKLGRAKSAWLAAASLDRYLMKIGQPQIFGSQFNNPKPEDPSQWTNEPYDKSMVSDSVRKMFYQKSLDETMSRLDLLKHNKPLPASTPD